jgi:hypothetical protein
MIDKRVPRKLNSSKDNRIRKKDEFNDALNISITDDYQNIGGTNAAATADSGDAGVIRPSLGNAPVNANGLFNTPNTERRCLGSVPDTRTGLIFFFIASSAAQEIGVYAVDTQNYFGLGENIQIPIFRSTQFNFQPLSFVRGEVVHLYYEESDNEQEQFRPYLYFTDNVNEPRRLDVVRAQAAKAQYNGEPHNIVDFITACPKTPLTPITFQWGTALDRPVSEFRNVNGFTFAYQCIYFSGEETALSTFSELAVPPVLVQQGSSTTQNLNADNVITLTISKALESANGDPADTSYNYTDEIETIRILVREGDSGTWFVVDEVDAPIDNSDIVYDFYNDRVLTGIRVEEANKQYDNLPQLAQAMAVVENRLFYGNYVEGYDNGTVSGNISVSYINRPADFVDVDISIEPVILPRVLSDVDENLAVDTATGFQVGVDPVNRIAGYVIDTSQITSDIPAGAIINFSLRISPARHWHFYNSVDSYHAHKRMGVNGTATNNGTFNFDFAADSGSFPVTPLYSPNAGVGNDGYIENLQWETLENNPLTGGDGGGLDATGIIDVKLGTSAAAPLVVQGKPIEFALTVTTNQDLPASSAGADLKNIICDYITGVTNELATPVGTIQDTAGYLISQPLDFIHLTDDDQGEDLQAKHAKLNPTASGDLNVINTITPVFDSSLTLADQDYRKVLPCACGYFMIRNANVQFSLNREDVLESSYGSPTTGFLSLSLDFLNIQGAFDDPEPGIVTCIPYAGAFEADKMLPESAYVKEWRVYKYYDLVQNSSLLPDVAWDSNLTLNADGAPNLTQPNPYFNLFQEVELDASSTAASYPDNWYEFSVNQRKRWIGGLRYVQGDATDSFRNNILRTDDDQFAGSGGPIIDFTMVDGEQGLSNRRRIGSNLDVGSVFNHDNTEIQPEGDGVINAMQYDENTGVEEGPYSLPQIMFGHMSSVAGGEGLSPLNNGANFLYPLITRVYSSNQNAFSRVLLNSPVFSRFADLVVSPQFVFQNQNYPPAAAVNVLNANAFFTEGEDGDVVRSFKTSANHSLGIVYYDERGRSGPVAPLPSRENPSVYVAGYSNEERDGLQGRVEMLVNMDTPPPPWAWYYQFVYAGNSTYDDFIQYSIGGAFVPTDNVQEGKSIYLSLNYLQYDEDVSYAEAWGAFDYTGDKRFYQFVPGDYLRIISYNQNDDTRVFPIDLIFEITDAVTLPDNIEENPIAGGIFVDDGAGVHPARRGSFIVVRDNPTAAGFSAADVAVGSTQIDTNAHNWNNRTIVEIVRPKKLADSEDRVYYEIGRQYRISRINGQLSHQFQQHVIRQGDVWWRRVPVNISEYDEANNVFVNLIQEENEEELITNAPRFRDVYLESMTFNDSFSGNNVLGRGKPKLVGPQRQRVRRFSSVTFSDVNDYATKVNRFTSFNQYNAPFKDLPNEYGNINFLLDNNGSLFVIQKDKASQLPVSRDIITTATGQDSIVVSNKILGSQIMYAGSYGSDNNPESVLKVDNNIYFAHKSRGEVYKFNPANGIQIISDKGMSTAIKAEFDAVVQGAGQLIVWVVSGYDPLNDEYLLTINQINNFALPTLNLFDRPSFSIGSSDVDATVAVGFDGGTGTGGGGGPDEPVGDVFDFTDGETGDSTSVNDAIDNVDTGWTETLSKKDVFDFATETAETVVPQGNQTADDLWPLFNFGNAANVGQHPEGLVPNTVVSVDPNNGFPIITTTYYAFDVSWLITPEQAANIPALPITNRSGGSILGNFDPLTRRIILTVAGQEEFIYSFNGGTGELNEFYISGAKSMVFGQEGQVPANANNNQLNQYIVTGDFNQLTDATLLPLAFHLIRIKAQADQALSLSDFTTHEAAKSVDEATELLKSEALALSAEIVDFLAAENISNPTLITYAADIENSVQALTTAQEIRSFSGASKPFITAASNTNYESVVGYAIEYRDTPRGGGEDLVFTAILQAAIDLQATVQGLNPNTLLDAQAVYNNLSARISGLQDTVNILTDQLEEVSSSTSVAFNTEELLSNVASGQSNALTIAALSQQSGTVDRQLTEFDILNSSQVADQLLFFADQGFPISVELVKSITRQYSESILAQAEGTEYASLGYTAFNESASYADDPNKRLLRLIDFYDASGSQAGGINEVLNALANSPVLTQPFIGTAISQPSAYADVILTLLAETTPQTTEEEFVDNTIAKATSSQLILSDQSNLADWQAWAATTYTTFIQFYFPFLDTNPVIAFSLVNQRAKVMPGADESSIPYLKGIFSPPDFDVDLDAAYQTIADSYNNA